MPLEIIRNDITKVECDAIVNAANSSLLGGGGVDGAIHRAAGPNLLEECRTLGGCETGDAKITKGYNLPCKYVIHTVGPVYKDGKHDEEKLLRSCYEKSLELARKFSLESVAFPLISSGRYGYPKDKALKVAIDVITDFLMSSDMTVYIVIFDKASFCIGKKIFSDIETYINENYVEEHDDYPKRRLLCDLIEEDLGDEPCEEMPCSVPDYEERNMFFFLSKKSVEDAVKDIDESFSQMLIRKIDEKGITDSECYHRANIDRKLFSRIKNNVNYKTSKSTVLAFAIALELNIEETNEMLRKAGYALSHCDKFDIIIEYFIVNGKYNIFEINEVLFEYDQKLLGC